MKIPNFFCPSWNYTHLILPLIILILFTPRISVNIEVKVGVIVESASNIIKKDIQDLASDITSELRASAQPRDPEVKVQIISDINPGIDPFRTLQRSCSIIEDGVSAIVSFTSCSAGIPLAYMTTRLNIPHLKLPSVTSCSKTPPSTTEIPIFPKYQPIVQLISIIAKERNWLHLTVFFDELFHESLIEQLSKEIKQRSRQNPMVKGQRSQAELITVRGEKIFDQSRHADYTKMRLRELQIEGHSTKFLILAGERNTIKLLKLAEMVGFSGEYFHWVIGNYDLEPSALFEISNSTNAIAVIRKNSKLSFDSGTSNLVSSDFKSQSSVFTDYIRDAVLLSALAIRNSLAYNPNLDISTKTYQLGCLTDNQRTFDAGSQIREALESLADTNLIGLTGQFSVVTNADKNYPLSVQVNPSLYLLSNGPLWKLIYLYDAETNLWTNSTEIEDQNGGFFPPKSNTLKGLTLRIVTIEEEPFIKRKSSPTNGDTWSGYCIDILEAIRRHNSIDSPFDYEIYHVADNQYGVFDPAKKQWTGLVGDVLRGKADLAVAGMIRNYDREEVVDFTASYMDYGVGILIRKPQRKTNVFGFLEPLTVQVWICICIATFAIGVVMFALARISPYGVRGVEESLQFNFHNSMWFALASLMQQGTDITPRSISSRMLGTFWWFFTLIVIATYTANLAAFLTVTRMESPIESLSDLAHQTKISYGTVKGSSLEQFFEEQGNTESPYDKLWNYMSTMDPSPMVNDVQDGYKRVKRGDYAFMWDYPVLQYQKKRNCDLMTVGKPFNSKNYAFAVRKGALYQEQITLSILSLQESGELEKIRQKWFEAESLCTDDESSDDSKASGLEMENVAGVFYILIIGSFLALFSACIELIWFKFFRPSSSASDHESSRTSSKQSEAHRNSFLDKKFNLNSTNDSNNIRLHNNKSESQLV